MPLPSSSKPFKHTTRFSVLSTQLPNSRTGSTGLYLHENREQTRNMPPQLTFSRESAHESTGAFNIVKDPVLEVLRFPLTCQDTLFLTFQPRGRGSFYEALRLRCRLLLQDSKLFPHPQATIMPLADSSFITNLAPKRNFRLQIRRTDSRRSDANRINTGDLSTRKSLREKRKMAKSILAITPST